MIQSGDSELAPPRRHSYKSAAGDAELPQSAELKKDEDFWYEDGTIALIAGNIDFRVYRVPLVKHSLVFREILSLPSSSDSFSDGVKTCRHQDCPVIHLSDSPEDLKHVLRVFASGNTLEALGTPNPSFHAVSAWIRLGHKYEIEKLVADGLAYIRRFYPPYPDLDDPDWIHRSRPITIPPDRPEDMKGKHAIGIVNLARLTEQLDLLPLALLECCKVGRGEGGIRGWSEALAEGYRREDGTVERLRADDLARCVAAREQLAMRNIGACLHVVRCAPAVQGRGMCENEAKCKAFIDDYRTQYELRTTYVPQLVPLDDLLVKSTANSFMPRHLCCHCEGEVERMAQRERELFWIAVPTLLGLVPEPWSGDYKFKF